MTVKNLILKYTVPFDIQLLNKIKKDTNSIKTLLNLETTDIDSNQFVTQKFNSIYTSLRTFKKPYQLLCYFNHIDRLSDNLTKILKFNEKDEVIDNKSLHLILKPSLNYGLTQFYNLNEELLNAKENGGKDEIKLTLTFFLDENNQELNCEIHVTQLNKHKTESCQVDLFGNPRDNPTVKHSDWARERQALQDSKSKESNEVLLIDDSDNIYEGLTSNFFVLAQKGKSTVLKTAPLDKVLTGTVQKFVLDAAKELELEVIYEFPNLQELKENKWKGAFLTSTSRIILPISDFKLKTGDGVPESFQVSVNDIKLNQLKSTVDKLILETCVQV